MKAEFPARVKGPQTCYKLAAENAAEYAHRQKEVGRRSDPPGVISRQSTTRYDTVDVRVSLQSLSPRMQNAEEADLGTEASRIGRNFQQRCGACIEQESE